MAHLTPSSELPVSKSSTLSLFEASSADASIINPGLEGQGAPDRNDLHIFRHPIAPVWEDVHNTHGGRWVIRLRKGCGDRVFEEVVYALVGERISADDGSIENVSSNGESKVNGVVLSVRKDEDILSVWCAPSSRGQRDAIRDSIRLALEHLLSPTASAALTIDYKPHPAANASGTPHANATTTASPHAAHDRHSHLNGDRRDRPSRTGGFGARSDSRGQHSNRLERGESHDAGRGEGVGHGEERIPKERSTPRSWGRA